MQILYSVATIFKRKCQIRFTIISRNSFANFIYLSLLMFRIGVAKTDVLLWFLVSGASGETFSTVANVDYFSRLKDLWAHFATYHRLNYSLLVIRPPQHKNTIHRWRADSEGWQRNVVPPQSKDIKADDRRVNGIYSSFSFPIEIPGVPQLNWFGRRKNVA